jgi:hypothetical protein
VPEKKKITGRLTTLGDSDFLREVAYWRRKGAQARFAESWRLSCLAFGLDPNMDHPMEKSIVRILRRKPITSSRPARRSSSSTRRRSD